MNKEKVMENQSQDKKAFGKLVVTVIVAAFVGGILGAISFWLMNVKESVANVMLDILVIASPVAPIVLNTALIVVSAIILKKSRKIFENWDGENEEQVDKIERWISYGMIATSVDMILGFFFFGAGIYSEEVRELEMQGMLFFCLNMLGLVYTLIVVTVSQKKFVNMEKEINPEKQGSVYDTKFQKVWLESCDEAERQMIYKAAYKAYQVTNMTCIGLWLVCVLGVMYWDFGLVPLFMVSLLWMVSTVSYSVESIRLSKHEKN